MAGVTQQYDTRTGRPLSNDQDAGMLRGAQEVARREGADSFSFTDGRVTPHVRPQTDEQIEVQDAKDWQTRMNPERYAKQKEEGVYDIISDVASTGSVSKETQDKYNKTGKHKSKFARNDDGSITVIEASGKTKRISRHKINAMMAYHNREIQGARRVKREDAITDKRYARSDAKTKATLMRAAKKEDDLMPQVYEGAKVYTNGPVPKGHSIRTTDSGTKWVIPTKEYRSKQKDWKVAKAAMAKRSLAKSDEEVKDVKDMRGSEARLKTWVKSRKAVQTKLNSIDEVLEPFEAKVAEGKAKGYDKDKWKGTPERDLYFKDLNKAKALRKQKASAASKVSSYTTKIDDTQAKLEGDKAAYTDGSSARKSLPAPDPVGKNAAEKWSNFKKWAKALPKGTYYNLPDGTPKRRGYSLSKKTANK